VLCGLERAATAMALPRRIFSGAKTKMLAQRQTLWLMVLDNVDRPGDMPHIAAYILSGQFR
jgi:hypothetical protein